MYLNNEVHIRIPLMDELLVIHKNLNYFYVKLYHYYIKKNVIPKPYFFARLKIYNYTSLTYILYFLDRQFYFCARLFSSPPYLFCPFFYPTITKQFQYPSFFITFNVLVPFFSHKKQTGTEQEFFYIFLFFLRFSQTMTCISIQQSFFIYFLFIFI